MSTIECPPTPPTLPEGEAAITPPPKSPTRSDENHKETSKRSQRRPSSPDPKCAICLGNLENMSYTNACAHKFCFVCLLEWSKVRAVCPLCKVKFKSIIHNIRSDDDYESYTLPPPPPQPQYDAITIGDHEENRRFRYRTTMDYTGLEDMIMQSRQELHRLRAIATQMHEWRQQLPTMLPPGGPPRPNRISAGSSWSRRRGRATSEFRRDVYRRNLFVDPESVSDITGRYRESSPAWYRMNNAQTHRLVPWLNRELNVLLEGSDHRSDRVTQKILQYIERFEIRSQDFHDKLLPYLGTRTDHFQHEFYHFARSVYDMIGYDRCATYTENNPASEATRANRTTVNEGNDDDDDIMVVEEVVRNTNEVVDRLPEPPPPPPLASTQPSSSSSSFSTSLLEYGPSTSTGISSSTPLHRLVIPASDSSDDSDTESEKKKNENTDDVEIVGYVKPRHERTPVIIDISSEEERHVKASAAAATTTTSEAAANQTIVLNDEPIEISSSSEEENENLLPLRPTTTEAAGENVDEENRQLRLEMVARAEFMRILNAERFTKRRILSYLQNYKNKKWTQQQQPSSSHSSPRPEVEASHDASTEEADTTWQIEDGENAAAASISSSSDEDNRRKHRNKGKGKGKGSSVVRQPSPSSMQPEAASAEKKRKKSKKRKKAITSSDSSSSSDEEYYEARSKKSRKKSSKVKRKKSKNKKKRKAASRQPSYSSTASEAEETSPPLERHQWEVSIKPGTSSSSASSRKEERSLPPDNDPASTNVNTSETTSRDDLRLRLSRKRPRREVNYPSSGEDDEDDIDVVENSRPQKMKSVVCIPR